METKTMRGEMLALLADLDDGTGDLGVVVDRFLRDHPSAGIHPLARIGLSFTRPSRVAESLLIGAAASACRDIVVEAREALEAL